MAEVTYSQSDDANENGTITLNGESRQASGRLDSVGDVVFADFAPDLVVVCERDADDSLRITIQHKDVITDTDYYPSYQYGPGGNEVVIPRVPLTFVP